MDNKRQRPEVEVKDPNVARKVQKADREKLRRDRLNEHFLELGNALAKRPCSSSVLGGLGGPLFQWYSKSSHFMHIAKDPDRPKNDKATIINDTIQVLKDLTTEVNRLKAECAALSEESRELTQEKNELREEKAALKSDVENLNLQYQQRMRVMFPWGTIDPSAVMAPPYSYPVPIPVPTGPIPMHPVLQPFPFFQNQNLGAVPTPCSTFIPYPAPPNHPMDQPSYQCASTSRISSKQDSKSKTLDRYTGSVDDKSDDSSDVVTDLELKMPGSKAQQEQSPGGTSGKQATRKEKSITDGSSSSSRYSSSAGFQDSISDSIENHEV